MIYYYLGTSEGGLVQGYGREICPSRSHRVLILYTCCCCSVTKSRPTLCGSMNTVCRTSLSFTVSQSLLKFMSFESMMLSNHLTLCCPLLFLPLIFPSIMVFSSESALHTRWPKDWSLSLSFSISPSNEHSGLISFRFDWLDLLAVQGTLKSLF